MKIIHKQIVYFQIICGKQGFVRARLRTRKIMTKQAKKLAKQKKHELTKGIFSVLESNQNESFNYKQIAAKLNISDAAGRDMLIKRLVQLKEKKKILEPERGK